jgi:hypothetical protein
MAQRRHARVLGVLLPAGGFERLHYLLESFWDVDDQINPTFIR